MNRPAGTVANRAWIAYLALGLVASTAYLFAPGLQGNGPLFNVISGSSAIAILLGLSLHRPVAPWVWRWFAIGQALFFLGDVYTYSYPLVSGDEVPFPSAGDRLVPARTRPSRTAMTPRSVSLPTRNRKTKPYVRI